MIRALVMCLFLDYPSMDNGLRGDQKKSSPRIVGRLGGILPQKFLDNVLFNNPGVRYRMSNLMPLVPQLTPGPALLSKPIGIENFNYIQLRLIPFVAIDENAEPQGFCHISSMDIHRAGLCV